MLLAAEDGIEVVGEAGDGIEGVALATPAASEGRSGWEPGRREGGSGVDHPHLVARIRHFFFIQDKR